MENIIDTVLEYEIIGLPTIEWLVLFLLLLSIVGIIYFIKNKVHSHHNKELYECSRDYLKKVEEIDRKPLPFLMLSLLVFAVVAEAMGFSHIFSSYILGDATGKELKIATILGSLLLAGLLVPLTHTAGSHIYYNKKVNKAKSYIELDKHIYQFENVDNDIEISNTYKDNNVTSKAQKLISRINFEWKNQEISKKYALAFFTILFIAVLAISSYLVRSTTYDAINKQESINTKVNNIEKDISNSTFNTTTQNIPNYILEQAVYNEDKQHTGILQAKEKSNKVTYFVLMFLFLAIQVLGAYAGMNWNFIGRNSKEAFFNIKNYKRA